MEKIDTLELAEKLSLQAAAYDVSANWCDGADKKWWKRQSTLLHEAATRLQELEHAELVAWALHADTSLDGVSLICLRGEWVLTTLMIDEPEEFQRENPGNVRYRWLNNGRYPNLTPEAAAIIRQARRKADA